MSASNIICCVLDSLSVFHNLKVLISKKKKKEPQISHRGIKTPNLQVTKEKQPRPPAGWATGSANTI